MTHLYTDEKNSIKNAVNNHLYLLDLLQKKPKGNKKKKPNV